MTVFCQTSQTNFHCNPKKKNNNCNCFIKSKYYIYNILIIKTIAFESNALSLNVKK